MDEVDEVVVVAPCVPALFVWLCWRGVGCESKDRVTKGSESALQGTSEPSEVQARWPIKRRERAKKRQSQITNHKTSNVLRSEMHWGTITIMPLSSVGHWHKEVASHAIERNLV